MLKEQSQKFKLLFISLDLFNGLFSCFLAFFIRYFLQDSTQTDILYIDKFSYFYLSIILAVVQIISFIIIDLYHPKRGISLLDESLAIFVGIILNLVIVLALLFFFRGDSFSRLFIIYFAICNFLVTNFFHILFRTFLRYIRKKGYNIKKVLFISLKEVSINFIEHLQKNSIYGYEILGFIQVSNIESKIQTCVNLGNISKIDQILTKYKPDLVIYTLDNKEKSYLKEIINACDLEGIDLKLIPAFEELIKMNGRVEDINGIPILSIRNIPIRLGYNQFLKRIFDVCFSFVVILAFLPFYIIIAFLVKVTSKGPIFIFQERVGLDGKNFKMIKFRSMLTQIKQSSDTKWTVENDPRVTKLGKFLRKYSIDETPQFFNVLIGNMSVVGPRPERPFFVEKFKHQYKEYMRRHSVKSGITGLAQIKGLRGDTSISERIQADIFYIENWSLWLDIKIILLTPIKGLFSKNAY